jgi:hypothetical protein
VIDILTDPLSVTYDGNAKSLVRVSAGRKGTVYKTADDQFEMSISDLSTRNGLHGCEIVLTRVLPDPTPVNVFDDYRWIRNRFGYVISFDPTRAETSVDLPRLRTALDSFVTGTVLNRLISGEK